MCCFPSITQTFTWGFLPPSCCLHWISLSCYRRSDYKCHNCFCIWDSTLHHAWVCLVSVGSWTSLYRILGVVHTSFGYTVTSGLHFSGFTDVLFCCSIVCDEFTTHSGLKEPVCSLRYKSTRRRDWIKKELCIWLSRKRITRATLQIHVSLSFTKLMFQALVSNFGDVCFTGLDTDVFVERHEWLINHKHFFDLVCSVTSPFHVMSEEEGLPFFLPSGWGLLSSAFQMLKPWQTWTVPIKDTTGYYGDFWIVANKDKGYFALHSFITWKLQFKFSNCYKHAKYFVVTSVEIKLAGQIAQCPLFNHCDYMSGNRRRFSSSPVFYTILEVEKQRKKILCNDYYLLIVNIWFNQLTGSPKILVSVILIRS